MSFISLFNDSSTVLGVSCERPCGIFSLCKGFLYLIDLSAIFSEYDHLRELYSQFKYSVYFSVIIRLAFGELITGQYSIFDLVHLSTTYYRFWIINLHIFDTLFLDRSKL